MLTFLFATIQRDSAISFPLLGDWTINPPSYFTVFGRPIYFYGILIALGFMIAILFCARLAPKFGIPTDSFYDLTLWLIPLSILGARLYFVVFNLEYYIHHPREIIAVWEGGLAIYGGLIVGTVTAYLFCRAKKLSFPAMLDVISFGVLFGQALGRWGNFFNREAFGAETDIFCRMGLTTPEGSTIYVHPTFLYESLWNLVGLLLLILFYKRGKRRYNGQCILLYFFWYGLGRAWIEGLRTDSLYLGSTEIRVSQLLSVLIMLGAGFLLWRNRNRHDVLPSLSASANTDAAGNPECTDTQISDKTVSEQAAPKPGSDYLQSDDSDTEGSEEMLSKQEE